MVQAKHRTVSIPDLRGLALRGRTNHHKGEKMTITMSTRTIPLITFAVAICLFTGIASQRSYSQERKAVNLSPTRGLPFSDGIVVGDTLYVAGQEGTDDSNKLAN